MPKDIRYKTVKILIETGHVKTFIDMFDHIPKSVVNGDFGVNYARFNRLVHDPSDFKLREVYTIAGLFDVDEKTMIDLIYNQHARPKKKKDK